MAVDAGTTLGEVKLRLLELLGLHPTNAAVYVRGALADDDQRTLAGAPLGSGWW